MSLKNRTYICDIDYKLPDIKGFDIFKIYLLRKNPGIILKILKDLGAKIKELDSSFCYDSLENILKIAEKEEYVIEQITKKNSRLCEKKVIKLNLFEVNDILEEYKSYCEDGCRCCKHVAVRMGSDFNLGNSYVYVESASCKKLRNNIDIDDKNKKYFKNLCPHLDPLVPPLKELLKYGFKKQKKLF